MVIPTVLTVILPQKNQQKSMVLSVSFFRPFHPNSPVFSHDQHFYSPENVRFLGSGNDMETFVFLNTLYAKYTAEKITHCLLILCVPCLFA
ncbi:hypothetical protein [Anaerotignum sp.]|uniref:hypothetical protein n=1 Tax=Anaerotignum sp. TaxID=2039241 RepID=UPI0037363253